MPHEQLPVAIIGAGPVGLAAAAHLIEKGQDPVVLEAGAVAGSALLDWGHVRVFSPWRYLVDAAAERLLAAHGWSAPDPEGFPTGREIVERYLTPLAGLPELQSRIRFGHRVLAVGRVGHDKMKTDGRDDAPFLIVVRTPDGSESSLLARAVIDASGTAGQPNPLGAAGMPAFGEHGLRNRIAYGIPDVLGSERARYAGKRILVVGSGHSAFNALLDLVDLAAEAPSTEIVWAVRRPAARLANLFGGGIDDALPARGELGARVQRLVADGRLRMVTGFRLARLTDTPEGIVAAAEDEALPPVDEIIGATGFRPDLDLLRELRLDLDRAVESPTALAPLIDPNVHSCGSVPPHGEAELRQPEPGFYIVGMKSYGRAPTFLMLTGYEQVRSIACWLAGDEEGAREVQLVLPETGVCSSGILAERGVACCPTDAASDGDAGCCGTAPSAQGQCCGDSVLRLIQLSGATKGACCG